MKIRQVLIAAVAGLGLVGMGFWFGSATAGTTEPGSAADPLVSKSYVDVIVSFQVVNVPKDSQLVGEGGTEIVLRAGQGTAVASASGGILDASDGVDMSQGALTKPNHLLVVPRTDGRGILAKTDLVLMVKGTYTIKPPANQPVANQPVANQPVASQPVASQPVASQPVASQPVASQPAPAPVTAPSK